MTSNVATVTISVNPKTLYVTNTNDSGPGSLRQALTEAAASNSPGADTIDFKLPGTGPFVIAPASPLPAVSHPTIINGYSQPGAHTNSLSTGDNAVIQIQIDGSTSGGADGLVLSGGGSTVEGLSITASADGILDHRLGRRHDHRQLHRHHAGRQRAGLRQPGRHRGPDLRQHDRRHQGRRCATSSPATTTRACCSTTAPRGTSSPAITSAPTVTGEQRAWATTAAAWSCTMRPHNTIGGSASGAGNVISGNGNDGVLVSSSTTAPDRSRP